MNYALVYILIGIIFILWAASFHPPKSKIASWKWLLMMMIWPLGVGYFFYELPSVVRQKMKEEEKKDSRQ